MYIMFHSGDIGVAVKLQSRRKNAVLGLRFLGEEYTPDFGHAFLNCTYFQACGRFSLSSVQRSWKVVDEEKKKERRRIPVKHKSADKYVGRPND